MDTLNLSTLTKDGIVISLDPPKQRKGKITMKVFDRVRRALPTMSDVQMVKIHHDRIAIVGKDGEVEEYAYSAIFPKPEGGDIVIKTSPISGEDLPTPGTFSYLVLYRKTLTAVIKYENEGIEGFSIKKTNKEAYIFCGETNGAEDVLLLESDQGGEILDLYELIPEYHDYYRNLLEADC